MNVRTILLKRTQRNV